MEDKNKPVAIPIPEEHYVENLHKRITALEERNKVIDKCIEDNMKHLIELTKDLAHEEIKND